MIELFERATHCGWHFIGAIVLICVTGEVVANIFSELAKFIPWNRRH